MKGSIIETFAYLQTIYSDQSECQVSFWNVKKWPGLMEGTFKLLIGGEENYMVPRASFFFDLKLNLQFI